MVVDPTAIPEKLKLPHQPDLDDAEHPCCIHGRNGYGEARA